jgi:hypothetical protein
VSPGFNPIEWGKGYTEGNAWHHSFPPYAITPAAGACLCWCLCLWFVVAVSLRLLFGAVLGYCLYAGWIVVESFCSRIETSLLQQLSRC